MQCSNHTFGRRLKVRRERESCRLPLGPALASEYHKRIVSIVKSTATYYANPGGL